MVVEQRSVSRVGLMTMRMTTMTMMMTITWALGDPSIARHVTVKQYLALAMALEGMLMVEVMLMMPMPMPMPMPKPKPKQQPKPKPRVLPKIPCRMQLTLL